ncbi:uncharacterized protein PV06_07318 [Exophiala oligosperma]|uniref:Uncharacterized protein n=2 Tax=Chaetothyriales TaxID=34395 RepID=A0A0D2BRK1_9EURO|nr:uncharacterized protein PV06_07318 [Exophiala oligosperma]KAJ9639129.1 hypothetical protein H2204_004037 [Knufia peltigerae]KIW40082.1 hypothetical protein PV06_07318 [Exophiala oligosperma]
MASSDGEISPLQRKNMTDDYHKFLYTASFATLFLAPVLIILPPRKFDFYTFSLSGAFAISANYQLKERTGSGLLGHMPVPFAMPKRAREIQAAKAQDRERQRRLLEESGTPVEPRKGSALEEKAKEIWMGGETEGWKERRLREEQEKIEQGEGYGSMIMDQIWEVWTWGKKQGEELKEKDQEALESKKNS